MFFSLSKIFQEEKFHTQLAVQYIDLISKLKSQDPLNEQELDENISRLRAFLTNSDRYRPHFLLSKVRDIGLDKDVALLYGKVCKVISFYFYKSHL